MEGRDLFFVRQGIELHIRNQALIAKVLVLHTAHAEKEKEVGHLSGKGMPNYGEGISIVPGLPSVVFNVGMGRCMEITVVIAVFVVPFTAPVFVLASFVKHSNETGAAGFIDVHKQKWWVFVFVFFFFFFVSFFLLVVVTPNFISPERSVSVLVMSSENTRSTNGKSVIDRVVTPEVWNVNEISRMLDALKRNLFVQTRCNFLRRHTGKAPIEGRCNIPFFHSHVQNVECGLVPMVGSPGSVATEKYLPIQITVVLNKFKVLLDGPKSSILVQDVPVKFWIEFFQLIIVGVERMNHGLFRHFRAHGSFLHLLDSHA
mmetsp:Transcript_21750/g.53933  ORF Transcript_21750/g.53933 Transcript_21750/m.53933 type:complete len:316 (+) Transcript_21750:467-1414(+)